MSGVLNMLMAQMNAAGGGGGAFVFSDSDQGQGASNSTTVATAALTVPAGALIVVYVKHESAATTITVADGTADAFTAGTKVSNGSASHGQFFYCLASVGGTLTMTATFLAARDWRSIIAFVYTYTGTASLDTQPSGGGATGTSTAPNSGNMTTANAFTVQFGGYAEESTAVVSAPLINGVAASQSILMNGAASGNYTAMWSKENTTNFTGAASCTLDASNIWICNAISFKTA